MGSSEIESAKIDAICEHLVDIDKAWMDGTFRKTPEIRTANIEKLFSETLPNLYGKLETLLENNGSNGFFVGSALSVAELTTYLHFEKVFEDDREKFEAAFGTDWSKIPNLKKVWDVVANTPKFAEFLQKPRATVYK